MCRVGGGEGPNRWSEGVWVEEGMGLGRGMDGFGGGTVFGVGRGLSLRPATVSLTAMPGSTAFVTDSNRPPTALATSSNRLSNRFRGRL